MATLAEVRAAITAEGAQVTQKINDLLAEIALLREQILNGGIVTAADLDELKASVEAIFTPPVIP